MAPPHRWIPSAWALYYLRRPSTCTVDLRDDSASGTSRRERGAGLVQGGVVGKAWAEVLACGTFYSLLSAPNAWLGKPPADGSAHC